MQAIFNTQVTLDGRDKVREVCALPKARGMSSIVVGMSDVQI